MQFTTAILSLAVAAVSALPFPEHKYNVTAHPQGFDHANSTAHEMFRRQASGHATYYNTYYPTFSSCGDQPQDTDFIAALAPSFMPSACGKNIQVFNDNTGASITVKVVDTCMACAGGSVAVDLTPTAFEALGVTLGDGTVPAHWTFV